MTDLSATIKPKSDQLNSDDLIAGPITIKITDVTSRAGDQPIAISFAGDQGKPFLPCKSMRRVLVMLWGNDGKNYIGRSMTLYSDPDVTWGGMKVGGIRISHMSDIDGDKTFALTANKSQRKPYTVKKLMQQPSTVNLLALKDMATSAVNDGKLQEWFIALSKEEKAAFKPYLDEYKKLATQPKTEEEEDLLK